MLQNIIKSKKKYIYIIGILFLLSILIVGSYAYWTWANNNDMNKNIVINTSKNLQEYIIYDEGDSKFVGDFKVSNNYTGGVHTTISIKKKEEAKNTPLYATINMNINSIGDNLKNSEALKWVITAGKSTDSNPEILNQGNFFGANNGDSFVLITNVEILTTIKEFTVWIWLDSSLNPSSDLSGEKIDTSIWTQVDQVLQNRFEITKLFIKNDKIYATAINSTANITHYAITSDLTLPTTSEWIAIPQNEVGNIYNLETSLSANKRYVWFKDSNNKTISKSIDDGLPYGTASLSLNNGVFTVSLSDYGDNGSGLEKTYGYALSTSNTCSGVTYVNSQELSKTFSNALINGETYYGCIKLTDKLGNNGYAISAGLAYKNISNKWDTYGSYKFVVPETGMYKIELWGAQGGGPTTSILGGKGGYTSGIINLIKNENTYFYVGEHYPTYKDTYSFNGGGNGSHAGDTDGDGAQGSDQSGNGGGATDFRLINGNWDNLSSLRSRLMVAAGGGGVTSWYNSGQYGGSGGGLIGYDGSVVQKESVTLTPAKGGNQLNGGTRAGGSNDDLIGNDGKFGIGGNSNLFVNDWIYVSGGGSGYYGGGTGDALAGVVGSAAGGSSYISGHTGCVAIESSSSTNPRKGTNNSNCTTGSSDNLCSIHYSGRKFIDTLMIDGDGYKWTNVKGSQQQMPNPNGGYYEIGQGHSGNGVAKITYIGSNTTTLIYDNNGGNGCHSKSVLPGDAYGELCTPTRNGYYFDGWYTEKVGGTLVDLNTIVSNDKDHTIYAHWGNTKKPIITLGTDGNTVWAQGNISSKIDVTKGSLNLNADSFKYVFSTNVNAVPNTSFTTGSIVSLKKPTGTYYLIVSACDVKGICTKKVSNPFYADNTAPTGKINLSKNGTTIIANVNATDNESKIKNYGYLIQTSSSCPSSGYTTTTNSSYNFNVSNDGTYYVCVKVTDNAGNSNIISNEINYVKDFSFTYSNNNYEFAGDPNGNWTLVLLDSGTLTINSLPTSIDVFLCGGGNNGGNSGSHGGNNGGNGGARKTFKNQTNIKEGSYNVSIGGAGNNSTFAELSSSDGSVSSGGSGTWNGNGVNGSDGGFAFDDNNVEIKKDYKYGAGGGGGAGCSYENGPYYGGQGGMSGAGSGGQAYWSYGSSGGGNGSNASANSCSGGGGGGAHAQGGTGGSGIVIIRNHR